METQFKSKPTDPKVQAWIDAEHAATMLPNAISDLTEAVTELTNQKCDFTGWNVPECLSNIYYEMKRMNDLKEKELGL